MCVGRRFAVGGYSLLAVVFVGVGYPSVDLISHTAPWAQEGVAWRL